MSHLIRHVVDFHLHLQTQKGYGSAPDQAPLPRFTVISKTLETHLKSLYCETFRRYSPLRALLSFSRAPGAAVLSDLRTTPTSLSRFTAKKRIHLLLPV